MHPELVMQLIALGAGAVLLAIAAFTGMIIARRHNALLDAGEAETAGVVMTDIRSFPGPVDHSRPAAFVVAEVVMSVDYFRSWISKFINIIGGEVGVITRIGVRARREALLRLRREAIALGHDAVCNIRLDTCNIRGAEATGKKAGAIIITIFASGTAYTRAP
mgnify:CR=1 FL=1